MSRYASTHLIFIVYPQLIVMFYVYTSATRDLTYAHVIVVLLGFGFECLNTDLPGDAGRVFHDGYDCAGRWRVHSNLCGLSRTDDVRPE